MSKQLESFTGSNAPTCSRSFESLETPLTDKYVSERNGLGYNVAADDAAFMRAMEQTYGKWRNRCVSAEKNLTTIAESHAWCSMWLEKLTPAATAVVERWERLSPAVAAVVARWESRMWPTEPATAAVIHALSESIHSPENEKSDPR